MNEVTGTPEPADRQTIATRARAILSIRDFRFLWFASGAWYAARFTDTVTTGWLVLELTDSPIYLAFVGAARHLPFLLFGVFGGILADRVSRRTLLLTALALNLGLSIVLAVAANAHWLVGWHLVAATFATNSIWALYLPARRVFLAEVISGRGHLTTVLALDQVIFMTTNVGFSALAGVMIRAIGPEGAYGVAALAYLIGLPLATSIRPPLPTAGTTPESSPASVGFRTVLSMPVVVAVLAVSLAMNGLVFPVLPLMPLVARDVLGAGPAGLGLLMSAWGAGSLVGGILLFLAPPRRVGWAFIGGTLGTSLAFLSFAFSNVYALSAVFVFLAGVLEPFFGTLQGVIIMESAGVAARARALGMLTMAIGIQPLGVLAAGALASATSVTFPLRLWSGLAVLIAIGAAFGAPVLRRHTSRAVA